ncbi:hypothetical protein BU26DRAFT_510039 [Trematosphaeria pertusa]|uniref:Uncharacterized protein n=1 Tax=Trematosphaeria pertusa TaxID=390896 RepID=A0A6A6I1T5_9PLEO|nr:uncharacterized protein BU26DRAFT_510039 [Trematosphaeria pertusa]KAF2243540.1 hypothetical protein BU26DRAFT_510039 [Trematosphaeria pertusa]
MGTHKCFATDDQAWILFRAMNDTWTLSAYRKACRKIDSNTHKGDWSQFQEYVDGQLFPIMEKMTRFNETEYNKARSNAPAFVQHFSWNKFCIWCYGRFLPIVERLDIGLDTLKDACWRLRVREPTQHALNTWRILSRQAREDYVPKPAIKRTEADAITTLQSLEGKGLKEWFKVFTLYDLILKPRLHIRPDTKYNYRLRINESDSTEWLAPAAHTDTDPNHSNQDPEMRVYQRSCFILKVRDAKDRKPVFRGWQIGYLEYSASAKEDDWKETKVVVVLRYKPDYTTGKLYLIDEKKIPKPPPKAHQHGRADMDLESSQAVLPAVKILLALIAGKLRQLYGGFKTTMRKAGMKAKGAELADVMDDLRLKDRLWARAQQDSDMGAGTDEGLHHNRVCLVSYRGEAKDGRITRRWLDTGSDDEDDEEDDSDSDLEDDEKD